MTTTSRTLIVSRKRLPTHAAGMEEGLPWYHLWEKRVPESESLHPGDRLLWYESSSKAIVWSSTVRKLARFDYSSKNEIRGHFERSFGKFTPDDYFYNRADQGHCLAYTVGSLTRCYVPKPFKTPFPQSGWIGPDHPMTKAWIQQMGSPVHQLRNELLSIESDEKFEPDQLVDERKHQLRAMVIRQGQSRFRRILVAAYAGRCAITGCDVEWALDACHILPHLGRKSNHVQNGLLLRADIHNLFDLNLIGIEPGSHRIHIAPLLQATSYTGLAGTKLRLPLDASACPNEDSLRRRWEEFTQSDPGSSEGR